VLAGEDRLDGLGLQGTQGLPAERVDDVVLHGRVQQVEGTHDTTRRGRGMLS